MRYVQNMCKAECILMVFVSRIGDMDIELCKVVEGSFHPVLCSLSLLTFISPSSRIVILSVRRLHQSHYPSS